MRSLRGVVQPVLDDAVEVVSGDGRLRARERISSSTP